jgi:cytoskeletal protein CcmA (bactofilin family)
VVFRKESKADAFQRQISALRHQLGGDGGDGQAEAPSPYATDERDVVAHGEVAFDSGSFGTREAAGFSLGGFASPASRVTVEPTPPPMPAITTPTIDAQTSVIAHDTIWQGDLQVGGSVHVHGRIEGSITARQDVFIAEEAEIDATITAVNVIVAGLIRGSIRCEGRFEALPQGRVTGDIQAPTLVVHEGAVLNGQFRMGPPESAAAEPPAPTVVHRRAARGG